MLTISLFNGDTIKGAVADATEIECDDDAFDDRHGHDRGDDDNGDDDHGDDDANAARHGDDDEGNEDCGTDALVAGARVLEAELQISGGEAVWKEVELFRP